MSDRQVITYMGNKRKLVGTIEGIIVGLKERMGMEKISVAEPFSGSGVVSRMLRTHAHTLHVNDIAPFSEHISRCYLVFAEPEEVAATHTEVDRANAYADDPEVGESVPVWMREHWSCADEMNVKHEERLYYTPNNAQRIDAYRDYIDTQCQPHLRHRLMGPLLYSCSVHTNTNGNFSGYYRSTQGRPWGGDRHIDEKRITAPIKIDIPLFPDYPLPGGVHIGCMDATEWCTSLPRTDIVYIDPPYNKHPYATYYFMLDIISRWDKTTPVPATTRGQEPEWSRSPFNSYVKAKTAMRELLGAINARFIVLSYNNHGIIPEDELRELLEERGAVTVHVLTHNTYNKMQGIADKKRTTPRQPTIEHMWVVECQ